MLIRLTLLALLATQLATAQTTYRGTVQDAVTNEPIPYVTVGLTGEGTGTTTDDSGRFVLLSSYPKPNDSLLFQALGYSPTKTAVASWTALSGRMLLKSSVHSLNEVRIKPKPLTQRIVLNPNPKSSNAVYGSVGYIAQIAQACTAPALPALLESVAIRKLSLPDGRGDGRFRLRIYGIDSSTGGPGADLSTASIEVMATENVTTVDLLPYKIYLPQKAFFVAVEWLKLPANEHVERVRKGRTEETSFVGYWPSIEFSKNQTPENNMWRQLYTGEWQKLDIKGSMRKAPTNLAIETRIQY